MQRIAAIAALSVTITTSTVENNNTWPFVVFNKFQERSASARHLSGAMYLQLVPIVTDETRNEWEGFAENNDHWLSEAMNYQAKRGLEKLYDGRPFPTSVSSSILSLDEKGKIIEDQGVSMVKHVYLIYEKTPN